MLHHRVYKSGMRTGKEGRKEGRRPGWRKEGRKKRGNDRRKDRRVEGQEDRKIKGKSEERKEGRKKRGVSILEKGRHILTSNFLRVQLTEKGGSNKALGGHKWRGVKAGMEGL
jgi:hypothetical protein